MILRRAGVHPLPGAPPPHTGSPAAGWRRQRGRPTLRRASSASSASRSSARTTPPEVGPAPRPPAEQPPPCGASHHNQNDHGPAARRGPARPGASRRGPARPGAARRTERRPRGGGAGCTRCPVGTRASAPGACERCASGAAPDPVLALGCVHEEACDEGRGRARRGRCFRAFDGAGARAAAAAACEAWNGSLALPGGPDEQDTARRLLRARDAWIGAESAPAPPPPPPLLRLSHG